MSVLHVLALQEMHHFSLVHLRGGLKTFYRVLIIESFIGNNQIKLDQLQTTGQIERAIFNG